MIPNLTYLFSHWSMPLNGHEKRKRLKIVEDVYLRPIDSQERNNLQFLPFGSFTLTVKKVNLLLCTILRIQKIYKITCINGDTKKATEDSNFTRLLLKRESNLLFLDSRSYQCMDHDYRYLSIFTNSVIYVYR
jgi:hypothetical protein